MPYRPTLALLAALAGAATGPALAQEEAAWPEIRHSIIGDRAAEDGVGLIALAVPKRAEDAAIVPIEVRLAAPDGDARRVTKLTVVVDENPAPVVGTFTFGRPQQSFDLSLRVRVNSYSHVRAIAETEDGRLYMTKAYVKAAGGCSAPASKDPVEARANLGQMRFRTFADRGEAQVQIRHPNYSGLQMDQVTRLYTPAWYVETLTVRQGQAPLFTMTGGISISEDPTFRFSFKSNGEPVIVEAKDTEGREFRQTFPVADAS
jgi:sulfur-oxidizing protein SoxY